MRFSYRILNSKVLSKLLMAISQIQKLFGSLTSQVNSIQSEILVASIALVVCYVLMHFWKECKSNLPPGPYGLPLVGYIPFISDQFWDIYKLGEKYGDVVRFKVGSQTTVLLHGVEVIKEALSRPEFLGRPPKGHRELLSKNSAFFQDGMRKWREQRRFVVQSMRELGLGKTLIEGNIMDEIHHFLDKLRVHNGAPMDLKDPLTSSVSNNISSLVFGKRYEYEDPERVFLDKNLEVADEAFTRVSSACEFPWLLKIPLVSQLYDIDRSVVAHNNLKMFFKNVIKKHMDTFDSKNIRDFIDKYILEVTSKQEKDPNTSFSHDTLANNVMDLFVAGSGTIRTTILWCVYVAAAFPQHQERVKEEILEVIGPERDPEYQDIKSMPRTHSFILEVMRWKTIAPLNAAHCTLADTVVGGYHIPKNAAVYFNLWNAHHDPNYWDDPESFIPDRFITKDGKSVSRPAHFLAFSAGKRVCPGEAMAMMELFLYFTSIIQKFQVVFPDGYQPTFKAEYHLTYRLDPYKIRFLSRR